MSTTDTASPLLGRVDLERLAREVHAAWRDGMLSQRREVARGRREWGTLSAEDRALDAAIALRVLAVVVAMVADQAATEAPR